MDGAVHLTGITIVVLGAMICGMAMTALCAMPATGKTPCIRMSRANPKCTIPNRPMFHQRTMLRFKA